VVPHYECDVRSVPASPFLAADVYPAEVSADLERVEEKLSAIARSSRERRLTEITEHLIGAGGKRVRPLAALLVFHACTPPGQSRRRKDMADVATALELIHSATLLHDDIIDGSDRRRGKESAVHRFGIADTLVAGDFVFSRAFELCAPFEECVVRWAADACICLTEGEMLQGRFRRNPAVTVDDYLEIIDRKTASLFRVGARVAAYLAEPSGAIQEHAARAGHHIGMAFQMVDDLLDVSGESSVTGKPTAADLRDGNPSLPVVLALSSDPDIRDLFGKSTLTEQEIALTLEKIRATGALRRVQARAESQIAEALGHLEALPATPARDALMMLARRVGSRSL
jgi:geranylgeranyl pyrophosphate synthase